MNIEEYTIIRELETSECRLTYGKNALSLTSSVKKGGVLFFIEETKQPLHKTFFEYWHVDGVALLKKDVNTLFNELKLELF